MGRWRKLGLIFCPDGQRPWMASHAANPFAERIDGSRYRIYFSCRDRESRSHVTAIEIDLERPGVLADVPPEPLLSPGEKGFFDDSGATVSCVVAAGAGRRYLYYLGWNLGVTVPWRNFIGLAVSEAGSGDFLKYSTAPVVDRSPIDPLTVSYPWVLRDGRRWLMWYGSHTVWGYKGHEMCHVLRSAESADGIAWQKADASLLPFRDDSEYAFSRPSVILRDGLFCMWYSYRGDRYRIGYAESADGHTWERRDDAAGIEASLDGWDSESIEYPCVFNHDGTLFMLYNGNGYGRSGFGLAVLE